MTAAIFWFVLGFFVGVAGTLVAGVLIASSDYSKREREAELEQIRKDRGGE